jgi:hypothetical protein
MWVLAVMTTGSVPDYKLVGPVVAHTVSVASGKPEPGEFLYGFVAVYSMWPMLEVANIQAAAQKYTTMTRYATIQMSTLLGRARPPISYRSEVFVSPCLWFLPSGVRLPETSMGTCRVFTHIDTSVKKAACTPIVTAASPSPTLVEYLVKHCPVMLPLTLLEMSQLWFLWAGKEVTMTDVAEVKPAEFTETVTINVRSIGALMERAVTMNIKPEVYKKHTEFELRSLMSQDVPKGAVIKVRSSAMDAIFGGVMPKVTTHTTQTYASTASTAGAGSLATIATFSAPTDDDWGDVAEGTHAVKHNGDDMTSIVPKRMSDFSDAMASPIFREPRTPSMLSESTRALGRMILMDFMNGNNTVVKTPDGASSAVLSKEVRDAIDPKIINLWKEVVLAPILSKMSMFQKVVSKIFMQYTGGDMSMPKDRQKDLTRCIQYALIESACADGLVSLPVDMEWPPNVINPAMSMATRSALISTVRVAPSFFATIIAHYTLRANTTTHDIGSWARPIVVDLMMPKSWMFVMERAIPFAKDDLGGPMPHVQKWLVEKAGYEEGSYGQQLVAEFTTPRPAARHEGVVSPMVMLIECPHTELSEPRAAALFQTIFVANWARLIKDEDHILWNMALTKDPARLSGKKRMTNVEVLDGKAGTFYKSMCMSPDIKE